MSRFLLHCTLLSQKIFGVILMWRFFCCLHLLIIDLHRNFSTKNFVIFFLWFLCNFQKIKFVIYNKVKLIFIFNDILKVWEYLFFSKKSHKNFFITPNFYFLFSKIYKRKRYFFSKVSLKNFYLPTIYQSFEFHLLFFL